MISPRVRVWFAWVLVIGSAIGWPVSAFTFAAHEPPTVLGLSWAAMFVSGLGVLATTDVRQKQEDE